MHNNGGDLLMYANQRPKQRRHSLPHPRIRKHMGPVERALGAPEPPPRRFRAQAIRIYEPSRQGIPLGRW